MKKLFVIIGLLAGIIGVNAAETATTLPTDATGYWTLVIAAVTPALVYGIKWLVPNIPKAVLPSITPLLGVLLGLLIGWLQKKNFAWVDLAQAGALAVFIREVFDQAIIKQIGGDKAQQPPPEPSK